MKKNENYLTEQRLGVILKDLFPFAQITPQYKVGRRIFDYQIEFDVKHPAAEFYLEILCPELNGSSEFLYDSDDCDESCADGPCKHELEQQVGFPYEGTIKLVVEYDGFLHYTSNKQVLKDINGGGICEWEPSQLEDETLILRIPYFLQLDSKMTKIWFNTEKDYSDKFPHGFISKKCPMPEQFSVEGNKRLLRELAVLPSDVSLKIYNSLIERIEKEGVSNTISVDYLTKLIKEFDPKRYDRIMTIQNIAGTDKPYKYMKDETYRFIHRDNINVSVYYETYSNAMSEQFLLEDLMRRREAGYIYEI